MSYGYIAKLHEAVERTHVRYNNRYGIAIAADVYTAKDLDRSKKHPALIVGAPYGGVSGRAPGRLAAGGEELPDGSGDRGGLCGRQL